MLIDVDPLTGLKTHFDHDHASGKTLIGHTQDCEAIIENNKHQVLHSDHKKQMKRDWIKYATIPTVLIYKWKRDHGVDFFNPAHWPAVMKLINDRDYAQGVKTTPIYHDR